MKKIGTLIGIASILVLASCSNTKEESSDKDTIVQEVEVPVEEVPVETQRTTETTTTTRTNDDGTVVEVDENGVVIGSKRDGNETRVKVTTDSTKIKIRRR